MEKIFSKILWLRYLCKFQRINAPKCIGKAWRVEQSVGFVVSQIKLRNIIVLMEAL
jgi:hypothetical protein